ncbi:MAG: (Na+)-NQR maturation NqrM [Azoarcus sp.]|nr:(Na+)-NQR maturation NqrM [Azoarcus sp.]
MSTFLVTLLAIVVVVALMAIGVMFGRRPITGSCGGLALLGLACDCEHPCEKKLARMKEAQAEAKAEAVAPAEARDASD